MFDKEKTAIIRRLKRATRYAVDIRASLLIPKLDADTPRLVGFADPSFAKSRDLSTQLGHICILADAAGRSVPISFKSYKSDRVVLSAMAGEVIAFSDLFDVAVTLASTVGDIVFRHIPVQLLTDSKVTLRRHLQGLTHVGEAHYARHSRCQGGFPRQGDIGHRLRLQLTQPC